jgi:hypothetical protein
MRAWPAISAQVQFRVPLQKLSVPPLQLIVVIAKTLSKPSGQLKTAEFPEPKRTPSTQAPTIIRKHISLHLSHIKNDAIA